MSRQGTPAQNSHREALRTQQLAQAQAARRRRILGLGAALVVLILVVVLIVVAVNGSKSTGGSASYPVHANATKDAVVIAPGKARPGVPTIDVYLDFQCPLCKEAEARYGKTLLDLANAGDITLVQHTMTFMESPAKLNNSASSRAATAANCADNHGDKYAEMTAAIYPHQEPKEVVGSVGYADALLRETLPAQLGIAGETLASYQQCYDAKAFGAFLADVERGSYNAGVTGTPTFTRNGKRLSVQPVDDVQNNIPATTVEQFRAMVLGS